jgi:16S rRNA (cytosine967-C5)-methyltransferase
MKRASLFGHIIELFEAIQPGSRPADLVVREFFRSRRYLGAKDRRFISELIYGLLRNITLLETYAREAFSAGQTGRVPVNTPVVALLGIYLIRISNESGDELLPEISGLWRVYVPDYACETFLATVKLITLPEAIEKDPVRSQSVRYSISRVLVDEWIKRFGVDESESLCRALNTSAPTTIRVNTLATTVDYCTEMLIREGIGVTAGKLSPTALLLDKRVNAQGLEAFKLGYFEMQDEGSQLLSMLVGARPGSTIVDACAGGGGKTLHLAALMQNTGTLLAIDVQEIRLRNILERIRRAGVSIAQLLLAGRDDERIRVWEKKADAVLIDAPCSGVGTLRRNPGSRLAFTPSFVNQVAATQRDVLDRYAMFVKPGGRLVYSTCTLTLRENEEQIGAFLQRHLEFSRIPASRVLREQGLPLESDSDDLLLLPHRSGTDGFYAALMIRSSVDS